MKFEKPITLKLSRTEQTARLYDLEDMRRDLNREIINESLKVRGLSSDAFWSVGYPQMLFDLLESAPPEAARLACEAFSEYDDELKKRFGIEEAS